MGVLYTCPVEGTQKDQSAAAHAMLESVLPAYAEEHGITRQAVFDLIRRCDRLLSGYEERLGLVEKFRHTREYVSEIKRLAGACRESGDITMVDEISAISDKILELV